MASSAGSDAFVVLSSLSVSSVVLVILRHYLPLRTTPLFLLVPIFLALVLPASALLLLPIDLASSNASEDAPSRGIWLSERAVLVCWRIIYWLTFVLTWLVLPLLGQYMDSGYREPKDRFIYSLKSNGRFQLIVLSCTLVGLIYIIFSYGFDFTGIKALVMALAYVWGLILAIYLMGHGLVAIPRNLFRKANISDRLRRIQTHAAKVHDKLEDALSSLEELEAQVMQLKQRKTGTARDFKDWIDELVDMTGQPENRIFANPATMEASARIPAVITDRYLADLTRRLGRARHQKARYVEEWDRIVKTASDLQAILDSKASKRLIFGRSAGRNSYFARLSLMTPYMRYHLYVHVIPAFRCLVGAVLALASLAIIWSEIIRFPAPQLSAVSLTVVHHPNQKDYQVGFGGQIVAIGWITYMCACALSSVSTVPVWNQRALVRKNTYSESACWYSFQVARLTVPLAYNFLTFLPRDIYQKTTFYHFLGRLINLTPLGKWFDFLFPIFVLVPVCATFFNLYSKIRSGLGFDLLDDDSDENSDNPSGFGLGGWREGRDLIARDLQGPAGAGIGSGSASLGLLDSPRSSADHTRSTRTNNIPTGAGVGSRSTIPSSLNIASSPINNNNNNDILNSLPTSSSTAIPSASTSTSPLGPAIPTTPPLTSSSSAAISTQFKNPRPTSSRVIPPLDPEPADEGFLTLFGRRVKNTIDTIDTPKWMSAGQPAATPDSTAGPSSSSLPPTSNGEGVWGNVTSSVGNVLKRPKWMSQDPSVGNPSASTAAAGGAGGFMGLFGGARGGKGGSSPNSGGDGRIVL